MDIYTTTVGAIALLLFLVELLVLYYALRIYQDIRVLIRFLVGSRNVSLERTMESSAISSSKTTPEK